MDKLEDIISQLLETLDPNPSREGLNDTPTRVAKSLQFLTSGYHTTVEEVAGDALFTLDNPSGLVIVQDIEFYSLCEHHLLPFFGKVHVGYLPNNKVLGLSKVARIVELYARRFQIQERLTTQIAEAISTATDAAGVVVVSEASHMCMMMRGVQSHNSQTKAVCKLGAFESRDSLFADFTQLLS